MESAAVASTPHCSQNSRQAKPCERANTPQSDIIQHINRECVCVCAGALCLHLQYTYKYTHTGPMEGGSAHTEQPLAPLRKRRVGGQEPPSHLFPSSCHRAVGWQIRALMFGTKGLPHAPPPKANSYGPDLPGRFPPTRIPL